MNLCPYLLVCAWRTTNKQPPNTCNSHVTAADSSSHSVNVLLLLWLAHSTLTKWKHQRVQTTTGGRTATILDIFSSLMCATGLCCGVGLKQFGPQLLVLSDNLCISSINAERNQHFAGEIGLACSVPWLSHSTAEAPTSHNPSVLPLPAALALHKQSSHSQHHNLTPLGTAC